MVMHANPVDEIVVEGDVSARARAYAMEKFAALTRFSPLPVLSGHVRFTHTNHRDLFKRVIVEANLDINGRPIRAQVAAATSYEAVDLARDRLRRKLSQLGRHPAKQGGRERSHRPGYAPRAVAERDVLRRKTFEPATASLEEAEFDLEMLDYDFLLFTDEASRLDTVVSRDGADGGTDGGTDGMAGYHVTVLPRAPMMTLEAAKSTLDATDLPFVFYCDPQTKRGNVLYRRHDGHYGLITPAV